MTKKVLISIGAGRYQSSAILAGQNLGYHVLSVDINPQAPSLGLADQQVIVDAHDGEKTLQALKKKVSGTEVAGVITQAARGCTTTAPYVAAAFGCLHLDINAARLTLEKNRLIRLLSPESIITILKGSQSDITSLTLPMLVKQDEGSGSTGIQVVNTTAELTGILNTNDQHFPIICHKRLIGRHFGVIGLATKAGFHFYGVLEQKLNEEFRIQETYLPATMTEENENMMIQTAEDYLARIGFNLGPFQVELIQDLNGNIHLAEIEASILGSHISDKMIPEAGGNAFIEDAIRTLTEPDYTPLIRPNIYQVRNKFPHSKHNPSGQHIFSRKKISNPHNSNSAWTEC